MLKKRGEIPMSKPKVDEECKIILKDQRAAHQDMYIPNFVKSTSFVRSFLSFLAGQNLEDGWPSPFFPLKA